MMDWPSKSLIRGNLYFVPSNATKGWKKLCEVCNKGFADLPKHMKTHENKVEEEKMDQTKTELVSNKEFIELYRNRINRNGEGRVSKTAQLYTVGRK